MLLAAREAQCVRRSQCPRHPIDELSGQYRNTLVAKIAARVCRVPSSSHVVSHTRLGLVFIRLCGIHDPECSFRSAKPLSFGNQNQAYRTPLPRLMLRFRIGSPIFKQNRITSRPSRSTGRVWWNMRPVGQLAIRSDLVWWLKALQIWRRAC